MRTILYLLLATSVCLACNNKPEEAPAIVKAKMLVSLPIAPHKIKGTYVGDFKGTPIAITLNYVSDNHASGYNVHKGLTRNITGSIEAATSGIHLLLSEPGNNPYDGSFDLVIDTVKWTGQGSFTPSKKGEEVSFKLKRVTAPDDENQYGNTFIDSIGNYITLKPDGACLYSYLTDSTKTGQQLTVRGNYTKDKGQVTVYWQKNSAFPSQKSVFKYIEVKPYKDEAYLEKSLKGEGRVFTEMLN